MQAFASMLPKEHLGTEKDVDYQKSCMLHYYYGLHLAKNWFYRI